jgi:hypothetical protein
MKHQVLLNDAEQMPARRIPSRIAKMPRVLIEPRRDFWFVADVAAKPLLLAPRFGGH